MLSKKQLTQEGLVTKAQYFSFASAIPFAKGLFLLVFSRASSIQLILSNSKLLNYKNMNPKFYLLGILIILGANLSTRAQISYNKRAMGSIGTAPKAGDFLNSASLEEVDMTTGTLKVGIPLYEIKVNDISVPITLNYSALGLKVGQEASPVGMGWELSAGGKIIRNVQGKVDSESGNNFMPLEVLANPAIFDPYSTHYSLTTGIIDGKSDGAWDTYSYILPNGGGTYTKDGLTYPYDPLITIQHPGIIKTTDGLIYSFVSGDHKKITRRFYYEPNSSKPDWIPIESQYSRDYNPSIYYDWNLGNIISTKFKDTVSFVYEDHIGQNMTRLAEKTRFSTSESLPLYRNVKSTTDYDFYELNVKYYQILEPIIAQSRTEITQHDRIKKIKFTNGEVIFNYRDSDNLGRDVLKDIVIQQVHNGITSIIKKYEFNYETQMSYGHYLKEINVIDGSLVKTGTWSFEYQTQMPVIPSEENKAQDRWGFYNGHTENKTLLESPDNVLALSIRQHYPIANEDYNLTSKTLRYSRSESIGRYGIHPIGTDGIHTIDFANREFSFLQATKGILRKVKTPTGATVAYDYEPHKFKLNVYVQPNNTYLSGKIIEGGGIRIKSITRDLGHDSLYVHAPEGKITKKVYEYGEASFGASGSPIETNGYGQVTLPGNVLNNISKYYSPSFPGQSWDVGNIMLLSHPVNDMSQNNGSYGMYKSVSENLTATGSQTSFGKTVYYNNLPDFNESPDNPWQLNGVPPTPQNFYLPSMNINAGVRRQSIFTTGIKKFAYKNGQYVPAEETRYSYKSFSAPTPSQYQLRLLSFFGTVVSQISGPYPLSSRNENVRDPGNINTGGGITSYLFNATHNPNGLGLMDYLTSTNLTQEPNTPNFPGKYSYQLVDMSTFSNCLKLTAEQTVKRTDDSISSIVDLNYYYDNLAHLLPTRITSINSKGDSTIARTKYAQDYSGGIPAIDFMVGNKVGLTEPIEEFLNYKRVNAEYIKDGTVNTFRVSNGAIFNDKVYKMKVNSALAYGGPYYNSTLDSTVFKPQISYDEYLKGNIYKYTEATGSGNIVLWGYKNQYPVAKITNAGIGGYSPSEEVAYSSFESTDKGNWVYSGNPVTDFSSPSGKKVYALANGSLSKIKPTSLPVKRYVISYWYKTGAVVNISGGTLGSLVIKNSKAGWTLVEREVSAITGTLVVSGTGSVDELRFHPVDAQMTTYTYDPLIGITGSIDAKGVMQYYEYDNSQRLKNVRDQEGNIVKSYRYIMGTSN